AYNAYWTSITNYEEQLAELRKKLESNETEKTMLSATITQLQSQMDGLQTEIADWAAKCEKISGTLLSTKENNHRKIRCLEERIRSLEGEKKTLESQIDHLEHEFSDYKAKAHSIIKQSSTVGVVPRHDSVSEAEQERLHKAIEVLKERIEDLNTKLASSSLEYLNITEEKEKQSARDEKLLRAAELRILKLSEEISTLKEEFKVSTARLQGENQALVILHQERFSTMHAEHRLVQDSLRRQIQDLEVEISSLKASKISEVEVESRPEAIVPVPSLVERGQGESLREPENVIKNNDSDAMTSFLSGFGLFLKALDSEVGSQKKTSNALPSYEKYKNVIESAVDLKQSGDIEIRRGMSELRVVANSSDKAEKIAVSLKNTDTKMSVKVKPKKCGVSTPSRGIQSLTHRSS
ncbi:hypothetical protein QYM36_005210, partial [Artemia franciscana]